MLLEKLKAFGPKAFAVALSTTMTSSVKVGRWNIALSLLQAHQEQGGDVDGVLLATFLRVCRAGHLWQLGLFLMDSAAYNGTDGTVYNASISMCADAGQWLIALNLLKRAYEETWILASWDHQSNAKDDEHWTFT